MFRVFEIKRRIEWDDGGISEGWRVSVDKEDKCVSTPTHHLD